MKKQKKSAPKKAAKRPVHKSVSRNAPVQSGKIRPLGDRVLIKEISKEEGEKTLSGIIIPVSEDKNSDFKKGTVVAVGAGKYDDGGLVPMSVKKGDTVLFSWGEKVKIEGEELYLVKESEISAILS